MLCTEDCAVVGRMRLNERNNKKNVESVKEERTGRRKRYRDRACLRNVHVYSIILKVQKKET